MCAGRRAFAKADNLLTEPVRQLTSGLCQKHHVEIFWRTWLWKTFHAGLLYGYWRWAHFQQSLPALRLPKMVVMAAVMVAVTAVVAAATMVVAAVTTTVDAGAAVMMAPAMITAETVADADVVPMTARVMTMVDAAEVVAGVAAVPMTARAMTMEAVAGAVAGVAAVLTMEVARAPEPLHDS